MSPRLGIMFPTDVIPIVEFSGSRILPIFSRRTASLVREFDVYRVRARVDDCHSNSIYPEYVDTALPAERYIEDGLESGEKGYFTLKYELSQLSVRYVERSEATYWTER